MSQIVIKAENISKTYVFQHQKFHALKNINFEIEAGEIVGLIGTNGSGKSTLLKIISRIMSPTSGKIIGNGRINSLLELGSGFHPELTGYENIFLNGAMLGMNKSEIKARLDEIISFAAIDPFLYIQIKKYSTGMYMRLAFSTAIHLPSEILILDEVFAVADIAFQEECLNKIKHINKYHGRTILFVSHDLHLISSMGSRQIILTKGEIA